MGRFLLLVLVFTIIGFSGMAWSNRRADAGLRRERWIKFATYLLILAVVCVFVYFKLGIIPALIIALAGAWEFAPPTYRHPQLSRSYKVGSILVFAAVMAGFVFSMATALPGFILFVYAQVLAFDAFSQLSGQLFGKHKLVPRISPNKTVEGFIGGMVFCILVSLLNNSLIEASAWQRVGMGVVTSFTALAGDLLASYHKRKLGIKDYSKLLPGQGGFLDRFDSFSLTMCLYAFAI